MKVKLDINEMDTQRTEVKDLPTTETPITITSMMIIS